MCLKSSISVYLHVVDMEVLLNDGCGLLFQLLLGQGRLGGGLGRWRGGSFLPLRCSQNNKKKENSKSDFKLHEGEKNKQKHCFHSYLLVNLQIEVN